MGKPVPKYSSFNGGSGNGTGAGYSRMRHLCPQRCGNRKPTSCCISFGAVLTLACFLLVYYAGWTTFQFPQQQQQQQQQLEPIVVLEQPEVGKSETAKVIKSVLVSPVVAENPGSVKTGSGNGSRYVVHTSTCKIPEMNPWDKTIQNFLQPDFGYPVDCEGKHKKWIVLEGTRLSVNLTALQMSGYSMGWIRCCYRIIQRVEQPWSDFDMNADNYVKYSDVCHPIPEHGVNIDAEFVRVHCISKLPPLYNDVVYRDFFALAQPSSDRLVTHKLHHWSKRPQDSSPPPNVVIIGVDNNSRMNSLRHLTKTLKLLQSLGAVEMRGYTKTGENTFPNTVPFLSGYSLKDLMTKCLHNYSVPQDNCSYVWKAFDKLGNYLTVHAEDSPYLGGFNYLKTGFVRKPTDFYLRPLMLAVMTFMKRFDYYHTDCIGRHMTDEFTFNYILSILRLASASQAPVFVHSWLTSLAHHSYNNLQFGDASISTFLHKLVNITRDNTIFFFMSDHGQRYGPIRETTQGWYEDKLPTQWVYIPPRVRKLFPEWHSNLLTNGGRLTSHFDVYKTLLHILRTFAPKTSATFEDPVFLAGESQYGLSLFETIPENRTCDQAGITVNFCACSKPKPMDTNSQLVLRAALASVEHLKSLVPLDVCASPTLKKVVTAGLLDLPGKPVYVLTFYTDPGDFLFEVNVETRVKPEVEPGTDKHNEFVITTDLLRMNKIARPAYCVNTPLLERYCYCK